MAICPPAPPYAEKLGSLHTFRLVSPAESQAAETIHSHPGGSPVRRGSLAQLLHFDGRQALSCLRSSRFTNGLYCPWTLSPNGLCPCHSRQMALILAS